MDTTTRYVVVWVSGVTTGLVMGERWRRAAAHPDPAGDDGGRSSRRNRQHDAGCRVRDAEGVGVGHRRREE